MNMIEGIRAEQKRCRELLIQHRNIGAVGKLWAAGIRQAVETGEAAIASGDIVRMIAVFKQLQDCQ